MKTTFITLVLAAQLGAAVAVAQTSTSTGTTDMGTTSGSYGSDWSASLRLAMFGDNGTTVRPEGEIANQWDTLSEEDKSVIRRDCAVYMQEPGGTAGTTESTTNSTTTDSSTGTADIATGTATGTSDVGSGAMITVSAEQMEQICAATKDS